MDVERRKGSWLGAGVEGGMVPQRVEPLPQNFSDSGSILTSGAHRLHDFCVTVLVCRLLGHCEFASNVQVGGRIWGELMLTVGVEVG